MEVFQDKVVLLLKFITLLGSDFRTIDSSYKTLQFHSVNGISKEDLKNINRVLKHNKLISDNCDGFILNDAGKQWANELNEEERLKDADYLTENEVIAYIDDNLERWPSFGEFTQPTGSVRFKYVIVTSTDDATALMAYITETRLWFRAKNYLIDNGFAVKRMDIISQKNEIAIQFTDKGRLLKELGAIEKYYYWLKSERDKIDKVESDSEILRRTSLQNALLQESLHPLIKAANKSTLITNRVAIRSNNILIAIFSLTAIIYACQLYEAHKANKMQSETTFSKETINKKDSLPKMQQIDTEKLKTKSSEDSLSDSSNH